ncbi:hypothetical protein HOY80DRAFT_373619 [Tuber brumale]|nr:hypothetical protein HOY80DRAFT_373619 [Tuber brumale]
MGWRTRNQVPPSVDLWKTSARRGRATSPSVIRIPSIYSNLIGRGFKYRLAAGIRYTHSCSDIAVDGGFFFFFFISCGFPFFKDLLFLLMCCGCQDALQASLSLYLGLLVPRLSLILLDDHSQQELITVVRLNTMEASFHHEHPIRVEATTVTRAGKNRSWIGLHEQFI